MFIYKVLVTYWLLLPKINKQKLCNNTQEKW